MKKIVSAIIAVCLCPFVFTACEVEQTDVDKRDSIAVYSFSGDCEEFTLSDGVLVFHDDYEIFYGGEIKAKDGQINDITAYTMTFYISSGGEKTVLLSNSVIDETGSTLTLDGEAGKINGDIILKDRLEEEDTLCFELETTHLNGEKNKCDIVLEVKEIAE